MTCPHCEFENRDDNGRCFRCGQTLDLSDVVVEPARSRGNAGHRLTARQRVAHPPHVDAVFCAIYSIVPGLGHALHGERLLGGLLALLWGASIAVAFLGDPPMVSSGPGLADWLRTPRWMPLTTHAWIIAEAYRMRLRQRGVQADWREIGLVSIVAVLLLGAPAYVLQVQDARDRLLGIRTMHVQVDVDDVTLRRDDVVAFQEVPAGELRAGDVVALQGDYRQRYLQRVGTVFAVAGDEALWSRHLELFTVNGRTFSLPWHIASPLAEIDDMRLVLQPGEILVFPLPQEPQIARLDDAVVATSRVQSVALRIIDPPERRRILRTR